MSIRAHQPGRRRGSILAKQGSRTNRGFHMTAIVLAMDGSVHSRHAASWLASTTSLAQPLIVHVVHVSPTLGRGGFSAVDFEAENREEARVVFESARSLFDGRVSELHE